MNIFNIGILVFLAIFFLASCVKVVKEYERAVIFRLGRLLQEPRGPKGPGLILVIPLIDRMIKVGLRTITMDVPPQDIITRDNVSVKVNAVVYFRVIEPNKAVSEVEDYIYATSQLSQTTLRSILGSFEMDQLLSERAQINAELQSVLDAQTDPWGIKVSSVEIKHVDLPQEMQRAMAKQAEAERERRAKIIASEGEFQAAEKMVDAAKLIEKHPIALQLRYLHTLSDISTENNSTIVFPLPIDLISSFVDKMTGKK